MNTFAPAEAACCANSGLVAAAAAAVAPALLPPLLLLTAAAAVVALAAAPPKPLIPRLPSARRGDVSTASAGALADVRIVKADVASDVAAAGDAPAPLRAAAAALLAVPGRDAGNGPSRGIAAVIAFSAAAAAAAVAADCCLCVSSWWRLALSTAGEGAATCC
jgi:hypothetical protein